MSSNKIEMNRDFFENIPRSNEFYKTNNSILCIKERQEYNNCVENKGLSTVCLAIKNNFDLCIKKYK